MDTTNSLVRELTEWIRHRATHEPVKAVAFADRVLANGIGSASSAVLARAHLLRGIASFQLDRMPGAYDDAARSTEFATQAGDTGCFLKARNLMATTSLMMGESEKAKTILESGLFQARAYGDEELISLFLGNLAGVALAEAKVFEAIELLRELQHIAEHNNWVGRWLGVANNLASCYLGLRDAESAAHICRQAIDRYDQHPGMQTNRPYLLHSLGCALEQENNLAEAVAHHELAAAAGIDIHDIGIASTALLDAARVARHMGNVDRAREHYLRLLGLPCETANIQEDSTEYRALATWGLEAVSGSFTAETVLRLRRLLDRGLPTDRDERRHVYDALVESLIGVGDLEAAVAVLQESLAYREALWAETMQLHAYSSAQAIQIREARRQAEEERWRREELSSAFSQVERLNKENEILVQQLREQTVLLERLSREDSLTGLLNRRAFDERHALELAEAAVLGIPVTTGYIDIDDFKHINDDHSHATGDAVLQTTAQLIRSCVHESDSVGRYGGEEFVLLLPGMGVVEAQAVGERINRAFAEYDWESIASGLDVTLCIGMWSATGEISPSTMMANADRLLYEAKRDGKRQLRVGSA